MLSRRNIRIKILQLLYSRSIIGDQTDADLIAGYRKMLDASYDLYLLALYLFVEIAEESVTDLEKRQKKHLPSEEDKAFTTRLYHNDLIQCIEENEDLQEVFKQLKFRSSIDKDILRQVYKNYTKEESYLKFATQENAEISDLDGLLDLFRFLKKNELFEELLEDKFYAWLDDKSLIVGAMKKTLKSLPDHGAFYRAYLPDEQTTEEFGMHLLLAILQEEEKILEMIKPKLQNWEVDRLATIDMIILKMAIAELIKFPSIPTRATINEYVEIAKNYSTDKSKEFVNGILDSLMKDLTAEGVIIKSGRGLQ